MAVNSSQFPTRKKYKTTPIRKKKKTVRRKKKK
jgi:hypothetical protein